jgi:4-amino-4-deoxy-L-arabinose transferase-like glycosyltransferase
LIDSPSAVQASTGAPRNQLLDYVASRSTWVLGGLVIVAAGIRFWNLSSLGFSHWDEFYFITNAQILDSHGLISGFSQTGWFTAPVVSYTDAVLYRVLGFHIWIPMAISALYGSAAVIALYFLASRLFGTITGLLAAGILATSEYSVMFSRMALADATFNFWLIVSVAFTWVAFTHRRLRDYAFAGIASGIVINTKYDGAFPLLFVIAWLGLELIVEAVSSKGKLRPILTEYRTRIVGSAFAIGIAALMFMPFVLKLAHYPGLGAVLAHSAEGATTLSSFIRTPPSTIVWYFWTFTSPPVVLMACVGIAVGLLRFTRGDRFMLVYTAGWFAALTLFLPIPRESLSLLPAVAIWAARGAFELWSVASRARIGIPRFALVAVGGVCLAGVLLLQLNQLPQLLSMRTEGYADAATVAAQLQSDGGTLFVRVQACALLYLDSGYVSLDDNATTARLLADKGSRAYLMTDQMLSWDPILERFFTLNRSHLDVIARIRNPLYPEVLLQPGPGSYDRLWVLSNPPDYYRYITFWRVSGLLTFPPDWPD